MNRLRLIAILSVIFFHGATVHADPMQDFLSLQAASQQPSAAPSLSAEKSACDGILASPDLVKELPAMALGMDPLLRKHLMERMRFGILQENREDLQPVLFDIQKTLATRPQLSTENMLNIPLRQGKLQLSFLFVKKSGSIIRCDKERFQATLDSATVDVIPDPKSPGKVIATFSGDDPTGNPLPKQPMGGIIASDGKIATIKADDGSYIKVEYTGNGTYKFSSNRLPVTVNAKYVD